MFINYYYDDYNFFISDIAYIYSNTLKKVIITNSKNNKFKINDIIVFINNFEIKSLKDIELIFDNFNYVNIIARREINPLLNNTNYDHIDILNEYF